MGVDTGAAYVFRFDGVSWTEEAKLVAADGQSGDAFGGAVGIEGDTIVVGASGKGEGENLTGAAYVFRYTENGWTENGRLIGSDVGRSDLFGASVAIDDGRVVVGAPGTYQRQPRGAAYVFRESPEGWVQEAKLRPFAPIRRGRFGYTVSISANTIVVGIPNEAVLVPNQPDRGIVYVFERRAHGWQGVATLRGSLQQPGDSFAYSAAIDGATIVVRGRDQAYVFARRGAGWVERSILTDDSELGDRFRPVRRGRQGLGCCR